MTSGAACSSLLMYGAVNVYACFIALESQKNVDGLHAYRTLKQVSGNSSVTTLDLTAGASYRPSAFYSFSHFRCVDNLVPRALFRRGNKDFSSSVSLSSSSSRSSRPRSSSPRRRRRHPALPSTTGGRSTVRPSGRPRHSKRLSPAGLSRRTSCIGRLTTVR